MTTEKKIANMNTPREWGLVVIWKDYIHKKTGVGVTKINYLHEFEMEEIFEHYSIHPEVKRVRKVKMEPKKTRLQAISEEPDREAA